MTNNDALRSLYLTAGNAKGTRAEHLEMIAATLQLGRAAGCTAVIEEICLEIKTQLAAKPAEST